jgi:hypothetical protein
VSRFTWTLHNVIGHPLAEVLGLLGLHRAATWVHDATMPKEARRG